MTFNFQNGFLVVQLHASGKNAVAMRIFTLCSSPQDIDFG
jgi:hypothetical protein